MFDCSILNRRYVMIAFDTAYYNTRTSILELTFRIYSIWSIFTYSFQWPHRCRRPIQMIHSKTCTYCWYGLTVCNSFMRFRSFSDEYRDEVAYCAWTPDLTTATGRYLTDCSCGLHKYRNMLTGLKTNITCSKMEVWICPRELGLYFTSGMKIMSYQVW